ncbi:Homeobox protein NOBOX [Aix galericulata]|nr:Homeobox protein NOBOX [Aix galericulata]
MGICVALVSGVSVRTRRRTCLLNTVRFVIDADPVGGHGTGGNVPSVFQSAAIKEEVENSLGREDRTSLVKEEEEDGSYCILQADGSTSQDSAALDCPINFASASGQLTNFLSDMKSVPLLPVVELAQEPTDKASLPLSLSFNPRNYIVPLMLDTPDSECSLSSQENGCREAFTYSTQNQGLCSPVSCDYPEQLESAGSIETPYCQYSSQGGTYQLPQYPQQQQHSLFHHLPGHPASNALSSVRLTPTTPTESSTSFLPLPGNSGVATYGTAGATQGYVQNHMGGQLLLQQPSGNSVPNGTTLGSMPHTGKQKEITTPGQSSYQSHQREPELTPLAEREDVESSSKKGESIVASALHPLLLAPCSSPPRGESWIGLQGQVHAQNKDSKR